MSMSSPSYISITQKPISVKLRAPHKLASHKKLLPRRARAAAGHLVLSFLAVLTLLHVFLPAAPLSYPGGAPRHVKDEEFWQWAESGTATSGAGPCLNFSEAYRNESKRVVSSTARYMMVVVSGGLNQQRNQIIDAVVVARILGAALVVPVLQVNQIWGDESEFGDIFDVAHFKEVLKDDVKVVSSLPASHLLRRRVKAPAMPFGAGEEWVRTNYLSKLGRQNHVLLLRAFDSRLAKNLTSDLQKLRCKVAFEALRFQPWIQELADGFIGRMREEGPYVALHLRLEKDVWVRTGCHSGLGAEADRKIEKLRASKPQYLTSRSKLTPKQRYLAGLCPLNANEITWVLKGLGAPRKTRIYWAGGEPLGGQNALHPLTSQFPNLFNKWSLANPGELDGLKRKPSVLAAIDYQVCLESQLFMASHGGNMARLLHGHRTFKGYGKPLRPNKRQLVRLFTNRSFSDEEIRVRIKQLHTESAEPSVSNSSTSMRQDVIAFPNSYCMCCTTTHVQRNLAN